MEVVSFVLLLGLMVFVHELGHFAVAKWAGIKVEEFGFGFPPRLIAVRYGETEYSINLLALGGFVRMQGEENPSEPRSFANAAKLWRVAVLLAGPAMNLVLATLIFAGAYATGWPTVSQTEVQVTRVIEGLPAEQAGVQDRDVIVSLDGRSIEQALELRDVAIASAGREVPLQIRRDQSLKTLDITPRPLGPEGDSPLGVYIVDRPVKMEPVSYPVAQAFYRGMRQTVDIVGLTLYLPVLVIRGLIPLDLARPVGPLGIYSITAQAAVETVETGWLFPFLSVAASLSAGLGIANMLPIPALDGGRLLFIVVEAIRGRRVSPEKEGFIHLVGLALLISIVVVITYFDVVTPVNIDWGLR